MRRSHGARLWGIRNPELVPCRAGRHLDSNGLITPPCGTPVSVDATSHPPHNALSHCLINPEPGSCQWPAPARMPDVIEDSTTTTPVDNSLAEPRGRDGSRSHASALWEPLLVASRPRALTRKARTSWYFYRIQSIASALRVTLPGRTAQTVTKLTPDAVADMIATAHACGIWPIRPQPVGALPHDVHRPSCPISNHCQRVIHVYAPVAQPHHSQQQSGGLHSAVHGHQGPACAFEQKGYGLAWKVR